MSIRLPTLLAVVTASACDPSRATSSSHPPSPSATDASAPREAAQRIRLDLGGARDGFLHVPPGARADQALPLVVFFHGAGGDAGQADLVIPFAEKHGVLVLSIDSRGSTWDVIEDDELGADVAFLDRALRWTFDRWQVDRSRIAVSGFSDGASYALTVGLSQGALFRHVIAFSPGFNAAPLMQGKPRVFVSHGKSDGVLPIDRCSRRIVPRLKQAGYDVDYREFDGAHVVPPDIARTAMKWLAA